MTDLLIGVAVLGGMALFVYAVIRAGRQQRRQRGEAFRLFGESRGWHYNADGDPSLDSVLEPFEAISSHSSPSLGKVAPRDVVTGAVEEGRVWVFWQSRRVTEGDALFFHVCLLASSGIGPDGVIVRFGEDRSPGSSVDLYYSGQRDRVDLGRTALPVFESETGTARRLLAGQAGAEILAGIGRLPWTVDLQIQRGALALYTIDRNLDLSSPDDLAQLSDVTCEMGRILGGSASGAR